jgi:hypothetical protein
VTEQSPPGGSPPAPEISFGDVGRALWRKLKEMKTAFYLLMIIAVASLVAAVVPQNQVAEYYGQHYGPLLGNLVVWLGLSHVSTAGWFGVLLGVLMLSLVACSRNLLNLAWQRWRVPDAAAVDRGSRGAQGRVLRVEGGAQAALAAAVQVARHRRFQSWNVGERDGTPCLYLCRHRWTAWGATLAHYAIFLVGIGALLGALPGLSVDRQIEVGEGEVRHASEGAEDSRQPLPFDIRLNSFHIETDPANGSVGNYYSDVSLLEQGQEVVRQTISVNHPLQYRGYYLSQSSWSLRAARVRLTSGGKSEELTYPLVRGGGSDEGMDDMAAWGVPGADRIAFLPGGTAALVATEFALNGERRGGKVVPLPSEVPGKPALSLILVTGLPARMRGGDAGGGQGTGSEAGAAPMSYDGPWEPTGPAVFFAQIDSGMPAGMGSGVPPTMPPAMPPAGMSPHGSGSRMPPAHPGSGGGGIP